MSGSPDDAGRADNEPVLDPELAGFLEGGVSVSLACRDAALVPDLVRCVACRVLHDEGRLRLVLARGHGANLLRCVRANGQVAAVFSEPSTHRTVQLKASGARIERTDAADLMAVGRYRESLKADLARIGFGAAYVDTLLDVAHEDLAVVTFQPHSAFDQTPGPSAGAPIGTRCKPAATGGLAHAAATALPATQTVGSGAIAAESMAGGAAPCMDAVRDCLEGATPAVMATCSPDGTPNISYLSQVQYVDASHIALSFQFFNKTRHNVLATRRARLMILHPVSAAMYRLDVEYLRTETEGGLFERMRAKLAGIASHTGMAGVFRLRGADVYRVRQMTPVRGPQDAPARSERNRLPALRAGAQRIAACADLNALLAESLACLADGFDVRQAMLLVFDPGGRRLYTVASRGYEVSGVGSEIPVGAGVIGVAAREGVPIRINHMTTDYAYGRAIRDRALREGLGGMLETEIPLPGLPSPRSQLAVPILAAGSLQGVLYVEDVQDGRFGYDDEDALATLAAQIGVSMLALQAAVETSPAAPGHASDADAMAADASDAGASGRECTPVETGAPATLRHYRVDDSVFLDDEYLIKGVAGAVLWALARDYVSTGRVAFTNRELRLDPRIRLPDVGDNLEARLVLLQRRLAERGACLRLERTGRGRLRLCVARPLQLVEAG